MNFILDTHTLVWWLDRSPELSKAGYEAISNFENSIFVSAISAFEITNKFRLGKWAGVRNLALFFESIVRDEGFTILAVTGEDAILAGTIVNDHRDPFDRIIVAQAVSIDATVITKDHQIGKLGAPTVW
jgi:PIN domain nuclease of toxin-antitoxin system